MPFKRALATLLLSGLLLGGCRSGADRSGDVSEGAAATGIPVIKVQAGDNVFEPDVLDLKEGEKASIEVTNKGNAVHDFTIKSLNLSTGAIRPEGIATATFTVPGNDLEFECTIHPGMKGKITVAKQ